jgi:hypothetical protein
MLEVDYGTYVGEIELTGVDAMYKSLRADQQIAVETWHGADEFLITRVSLDWTVIQSPNGLGGTMQYVAIPPHARVIDSADNPTTRIGRGWILALFLLLLGVLTMAAGRRAHRWTGSWLAAAAAADFGATPRTRPIQVSVAIAAGCASLAYAYTAPPPVFVLVAVLGVLLVVLTRAANRNKVAGP